MAVTYIQRRDTKRGTENDKVRQLIDEYIVTVDSTNDEPSTIISSDFVGANGVTVPKVGDPHPVDPLVTCKSLNVTPTENRLWWMIEANYDNAQNDQGTGGGGGGNVEVLKVTVGVWFEDYIQEYRLDERGAGGKARILRDTAGSPIKYEARRPHPLVTISAQTEAPAIDKYLAKVNTVNDNIVNWQEIGLIFAKDQLMFDSYNATSIGANKWQEDFVFKAKVFEAPRTYDERGNEMQNQKGGWQPWLLNAGLWELVRNDQGQDERVPIYPRNEKGDRTSNTPVNEPWPLTIAGQAIALQNFDDEVEWLNPQMFSRTNFAAFNFDFTLVLSDKYLRNKGLK